MAEPSTPTPKPRFPWPTTALVATLAVAAALILLIGRERKPPGRTGDRPLEPVAQVQALNGAARAVRGDERRPLAARETVYVGEGVEAEAGASLSLLTYPAEARLGLAGGGQLFFETPAEVRVDGGRLQADVGTAVTQLITPHAKITALQTRLAVDVSVRGTQIDVQKGDALVESADMKQRVRAGARFFLSARPPVSAERPH